MRSLYISVSINIAKPRDCVKFNINIIYKSNEEYMY